MTQPWFHRLEDVLEIHRSLIETYGGSDGLRDAGLLTSALAMPQSSFGGEFLHKDLHEMAAAYLYHIVQNHPFLDGNKRTGAASAIIFLEMNDIKVVVDQNALVDLVLGVACGSIGKPQIADFFREFGQSVLDQI